MSEEMSNEVLDALNSMNEELSKPDITEQPTSSTTDLQSSARQKTGQVATNQASVPIKKQLKIFEEINIQMGRFCQALKVVDARFEQQAQVFYKAADELGKKEKLSDEESIELAVNIAAWATVKLFGKIYANLQKSKQLSEVKRILKQEADVRLDSVKQLKGWMPSILETAYDRYNNVADFESITRCVSNLRESEYMNAVVLFLEATYEAALQNKFQDTYAYPSFAPINRHILYGILCGKPELACDDYLEGRRNCIEGLISKTEEEIKGKEQLSKEAYVFASDPQVMAIAIHDVYPMTDSYDVEIDESLEEERLVSQNYYSNFVQLYEDAEIYPQNIIAQAALNNDSLIDTVTHYQAIERTFKDHDALCAHQLSIIGLSGLSAFLSIWLTVGWSWYWALLIGVIVGAIVYWIMPTKKATDKAFDKLIRIEKSIQDSNKTKGGDVKMVDLAFMESQTNSPWKGALIGAILGIPFILWGGPLWGAIIGFIAVLIFGGKDEEEEADYSYEHIKVAPTWIMKSFMYLLIVACIGSVVYFFAHRNQETKKLTNIAATEIVTPVEEVEEVAIAVPSHEVYEEISSADNDIQDDNTSEDEQLIRMVFDKYVFNYSDEDPHKYFGTKAIHQLEEAYEYDGEGYGFWDLNIPLGEEDPSIDQSSNEFGTYTITSINKEENGWYKVFFQVSGIAGYNRLRVLDGKIEEYEPGKYL